MASRTILPLLAIGLLVGCSDDKSSRRIVEPDPGYPVADTADQLVANFESSYEERNVKEFDDLLADDFVFYFSVEDVDLSPGGQGFWDRASELASATTMFSGMEGLKESGEVQPAVQSITLQLQPVSPEWSDASVDGAEFAGTLKRLYEADMTVEYTAGDILSSVSGQQVFYVQPVLVDGTEVYRLFAWRDLGNPLGKSIGSTESATWSRVKALYR